MQPCVLVKYFKPLNSRPIELANSIIGKQKRISKKIWGIRIPAITPTVIDIKHQISPNMQPRANIKFEPVMNRMIALRSN